MAKQPKIIFFDLETLPIMDNVMKFMPRLYEYSTIKISSIICFGYKQLGTKKAKCISAWDFPAWKKDVNDDYLICKWAYEILKDADAIVTHNGIRFDLPLLQARLIHHGLPMLPKIPHIDTCFIARKKLLLFSNKLDDLASHLKVKGKLKHSGWQLWEDTQKKKKKALKTMTKYCKQDVEALESVFLKLRPLISNLPNHNIFKEDQESRLCANCGGFRVHICGKRVTKTAFNQRFRCYDCGSYSYKPIKAKLLRSE